MEYREAIDYLYSIPMFTKVGSSAYKPGYERIEALMDLLEEPHRAYRTIHVAGTNGKGSSSSMIASVLMSAGYRVGLYSSPHLFDFRERIKVDGRMIPHDDVVRCVELLKPVVEGCSASFFEVVTAMAFDYFRSCEVDFAIIETGLGGLLDATNIITPIATLITNIGYDHTAILGETLFEIASQKAGIIKPGVPLVIGEYSSEATPVIESVAKELSAPYLIADREYIPMARGESHFDYSHRDKRVSIECDQRGDYQQKNVASVVALFDLLREQGVMEISSDVLFRGLGCSIKNCGLQGRWQQLSSNPTVICDTGHNSHGLRYIFNQLIEQSGGNFTAVMGFAADKDLSNIFDLFPNSGRYIFTDGENPRLKDCSELLAMAEGHNLDAMAISGVAKAVAYAVDSAKGEQVIFIGGSNFVVAEIDLSYFD